MRSLRSPDARTARPLLQALYVQGAVLGGEGISTLIVIQYIGIAIFIIGGLGLLIAAFRTSLLWGLACLLVWPAALAFTFVHWADAKNPFFLQLFGFSLLLVGGYAGDLL